MVGPRFLEPGVSSPATRDGVRLVTGRVVMRRSLLIGLVGALLHLAGASPASACDCVPISDRTALADADAVFVGSLVSRTVEVGERRTGGDTAVHRFEVRAVYKGEVRRDQEVVSTGDGDSCGFQAPPDIEVLVFANRTAPNGPQPGSGQFAGNLCNGTRPLEPRPVSASFGKPALPQQTGLDTPRKVDDDDGPLLRWMLISASGAAVVALATMVALWRRAGRHTPRSSTSERHGRSRRPGTDPPG